MHPLCISKPENLLLERLHIVAFVVIQDDIVSGLYSGFPLLTIYCSGWVLVLVTTQVCV